MMISVYFDPQWALTQWLFSSPTSTFTHTNSRSHCRRRVGPKGTATPWSLCTSVPMASPPTHSPPPTPLASKALPPPYTACVPLHQMACANGLHQMACNGANLRRDWPGTHTHTQVARLPPAVLERLLASGCEVRHTAPPPPPHRPNRRPAAPSPPQSAGALSPTHPPAKSAQDTRHPPGGAAADRHMGGPRP